MRVHFLIAFFFTSSLVFVKGQSLGQDTENFSTIVFPSTNVSINLNKSAASFSLYRDSRLKNEKPGDLETIGSIFEDSKNDSHNKLKSALISIYKKNNKVLNKNRNSKYITWGVDFKGESTNGVATIFSSDKIAPSASAEGLIGYRWTRHHFREDLVPKFVEVKQALDNNTEIIKKINELNKKKVIPDAAKAFMMQTFEIDQISQRIAYVMRVVESIKEFEIPPNNPIADEIKQLKALEQGVLDVEALLTNKPIIEAKLFDEIKKLKTLIDDKKFAALTKLLGFDTKNLYSTSWVSVKRKIKSIYFQKKELVVDKKENTVYNGAFELKELKKLLKKYKQGLEVLNGQDFDTLNDFQNKVEYFNRFLIYIRGGVSGSNFKYDLDNDATTIDTRFQNIKFNGFNLELGTTFQLWELDFFGFSLGYSYTNNLSELGSQTFALQVVDPNIMDGNFVSVTEVKAKTGDFDRFNRLDLNFDYSHLFRITENQSSEEKSYLLLSLNPFVRHRIYENAEVLRNNTVLGLGIHAYNSKDNKIMGGVYFQSPDVFGTHKENEDLFEEGFNFGIIVRYNFQGLKTK